MHEHAGCNVANEDTGVFETETEVRNSNHLFVRRIRGVPPHTVLHQSLTPDDGGYAACLEVPTNDT